LIRSLGVATGIALVLAALAPPAWTQGNPQSRRFFEFRVPLAGPRLPEQETPPLSLDVRAQIERGRALAEAGRFDAARDTLNAALARAPHHPEVLIELANLLQARNAWKPLEQMARAERSAAHDSLLLGEDLVLAYQHQGKPRDGAQTALEAWIASPIFGTWARAKIDTLALADPKGVREVVQRVAASLPMRVDIIRGAAAVTWNTGDAPGAMRILKTADDAYKGAPLRWSFAEELLAAGTSRDSAGAIEVLIDLSGDRGRDLPYRLVAARRAWEVYERRGGAREGAPRVAKALTDVPVGKWGSPLAIEVIRGLREAGATEDARRLLQALSEQNSGTPEIAIEHALNDLRDGPPERALPPLAGIAASSETGAFFYAEALFFAGQSDSALAWYGRASKSPSGAFTGAALERIYTIEDGRPKEALPTFGRLAYEQWRNDSRKALTLADSLYRTLPRASLWAQAAIALATLREKTGDGKGALEPLLALAEGLPNDRLAPLARQRAGDLYRSAYHDDAKALAQYEECLARYPKAWNAPEVRRRMEALKRGRL